MGRGVAHIRNDDGERLRRILNDKERLFGVDVVALNNQIARKTEQHSKQHTDDIAYAEREDIRSRRVAQLQKEAERQRKALELDCADFWKQHQKKTTTREWDLNRRDHVRIALPGRLSDDDPRCGPSSLQKFDGEDLGAGQRKMDQIIENRANWSQQEEEHRQQEAEKNAEEKRDADIRRQQDDHREACAHEANVQKRQTNCTTSIQNQQLAKEKYQTRCNEIETERAQNGQELLNMQQSAFLNETLPRQIRKECWKGMGVHELQSIEAVRQQQCDERQQKSAEAKQEEGEAARREAAIQRRAFAAARRGEILRRERAKEVAQMLKSQMTEKIERDDARDALYSNHVSPHYFAQFQTSHR